MQALYFGTKGALRQRDEKGDGRTALQNSRTDSNGLVAALYFNGLNPTNTLGCGSWGHNSISENLNYTHLMNVSRVARFMPDNYVPSEEELWGE